MKKIEERVQDITAEFAQFKDWEGRYKHLVEIGKKLPIVSDDKKTDTFKVRGCQSQVWLIPRLEDNRVYFEADSDASIVKGIVALLLAIYSDNTPQEILNLKLDFLDSIGLKQHLSMNRANGLASMVKQIQMYAYAYQTQIGQR
ncbi:MAG: Fe-S metabolism protein SufE [Bdellovibrio sp. CG12_big_fil_rev_8_21_14_0_65_39_13]|nr:MAG: Fe-S metabolism protein SufE [Bdellovibrio sp. CG22_combo_CG10-13_8_21_14_all_39_27]PIQ62986.1 MAG: Fe-S metabolism protein SufE [Bdellovibrio sp. CG12_big_fil_rev_8_21_14_0_65_39_13]PIR32660.1 MAG: Fe-S metabolism protein SufE [Bdellovibrio sp. CG11_big_fil_rev_8_21_14_0_20_39_38]PJB53181.1 MAG: Fe-S metabolism protein SufE [Bdellovibrio sp. CG_4_9_14_3_um_filter_39_7]